MQAFVRGVMLGTMATVLGGMMGFGTAAQGNSAQNQVVPRAVPMAEEVLKDIQVLKGIPVDEFLDTMGMFAAATTKDCSGCHDSRILDGDKDAFAISTPMIQRARQMTLMVNSINRTYFGGQRRVTCYTCHSARELPPRVPNLTVQYGEPPAENPDRLDFTAIPERSNETDAIFAKFLEGIGGSQRWAAIKTMQIAGTYAGWDTSHREVPVEIFGRAPQAYATVVHRVGGDDTFVYDGTNAWFAGIDVAAPNFTLQYTGGNLEGAKIDALVAVAPHMLQKAFGRWDVSEDVIDDGKPVTVLRGTNPGPGRLPVNLYFDEAGVLVRLIRWSDTAVGPVPTRFDFADYREVGGIRKPFEVTKTWTNNRVVFRLKDVRLNVPIDAARFNRPAPVTQRGREQRAQ